MAAQEMREQAIRMMAGRIGDERTGIKDGGRRYKSEITGSKYILWQAVQGMR
jgi:hypothetical protein